MAGSIVISRSTRLGATAARVWEHASTLDGVNAELRPWVRMTHPPDIVRLQQAIGSGAGELTCWLLLLGVVPFDRHALRLIEVDDLADGGGRFVEDSTSWLQRRWRHTRSVAADGELTCRVTDHVLVEPCVGTARPAVGPVVAAVFRHRHRVLARRFGRA